MDLSLGAMRALPWNLRPKGLKHEILSNVVFDRLGGLSFNTHSIFKSPSNIDHIC